MADILGIGITGLGAARKSLEVTGHNIANVNTKGYSRQRVNQEANATGKLGGLVTGSGVRVRSVERYHDPQIEKRMQSALSEEGYFNERVTQLERIEGLFNEVDGEGLHKTINTFYNAFRQLATQPENEAMRSVVRDKARIVINTFKRIGRALNDYVDGIDLKIKTEVSEVNSLLKKIAKLNVNIRILEGTGGEASDLKDKRDATIQELARSFRVRTYVDGKGNYNVLADGLGSLVSGGSHQELGTAMIPDRITDGIVEPTINIHYVSNRGFDLTPKIKLGVLGSLVRVRNNDIQEFREKLDSIAYELIKTTNAVHNKGYVHREISVDEDGNAATKDAFGSTTGINFFAEPKRRRDISLYIDLSDDVKKDLSNIVSALAPNSPGDNRVAIAISKLQHQNVMQRGTATVEEAYLQAVGRIGVETGKARLEKEQADGLIAQSTALRERIAGVSLDEEAANMVRFQHAYDASAKVLQSAERMFDTILSIKS